MKIGFCLNMVSHEPDGTGLEMLEALSKLGFDYAELPIAEMFQLDRAQQLNIPKLLERHNIPCLSCNNLFPKEIRLTGPDMDIRRIRSYADSALELAEMLGAKTVVFGSGVARNVPDGYPMTKAFDQLVCILNEIDEIADKRGITLVLEAACKTATNIINSFEEACRWRDCSSAVRAKVMIDFFHQISEDKSQISLTHLSRKPGHVHIACPMDNYGRERRAPCSNDGFDYSAIVSALKEHCYDELISIEAYTDDFMTEAKNSLQFLRSSFS